MRGQRAENCRWQMADGRWQRAESREQRAESRGERRRCYAGRRVLPSPICRLPAAVCSSLPSALLLLSAFCVLSRSVGDCDPSLSDSGARDDNDGDRYSSDSANRRCSICLARQSSPPSHRTNRFSPSDSNRITRNRFGPSMDGDTILSCATCDACHNRPCRSRYSTGRWARARESGPGMLNCVASTMPSAARRLWRRSPRAAHSVRLTTRLVGRVRANRPARSGRV